jgi:hypothetical protein
MPEVCWVSLDPRLRKIDFYPRAIAARIEKSYGDRDTWAPSMCVLGSDFFNATINFHPSGSCYQTTPGMSLGRNGYKQPGYRSAKRCIKDPESNTITIYSRQVHCEWRIAANEIDSDIKFEETIPPECLVNCISEEVVEYNLCAWTGDDLSSSAWDANVIVWQWCRGVPERQGNLMALSDEWWCPYLANENSIIETAFLSNECSVDVELPICGTRTFRFNPGQAFASQNDVVNRKSRVVRRVTKTIQELKVMLDRMSTPPVDIAELLSSLPDGTIPHHFFCCITQDLMSDPVKTIDGHTYDRPAIERWFLDHSTSPLTGLSLGSKVLVPNTILREQIESFAQSQVAAVTEQLSTVAVAP